MGGWFVLKCMHVFFLDERGWLSVRVRECVFSLFFMFVQRCVYVQNKNYASRDARFCAAGLMQAHPWAKEFKAIHCFMLGVLEIHTV